MSSWVDFHAHILPEADHGSCSVEMSLAQLRLASEAGFGRVVATPHFYPHCTSAEHFIAIRNAAYVRLMERISAGVDFPVPQLRLGAEVLICEGLENMKGLENLCIYGSSILLLELPFGTESSSYATTALQLIRRGFSVVVAHADRYSVDMVEAMIGVGCRLQFNAAAVAKLFPKPQLQRWFARGLCVALGSDIHENVGAFYRNLLKGRKKFSEFMPAVDNSSDILWNMTSPFPL